MRHLRHQLIDLLDQARSQHRMDTVPPRLMAALVQDFLALLPKGKSSRVAMHSRTLTHGNLHRHIFTIRCPDQAFYLDAIKGYMSRCGIQPIGQQTMVARMLCDADGCELELKKAAIHDADDPEGGNFMFIALHLSAAISPDAEPIRKDIHSILQAVDLSVRDFDAMRKCIAQSVAQLMGQQSDDAALLDWMNDNHYLYFGIQYQDTRLGLMKNSRVLKRVAPGLMQDIDAIEPATQAGVEWINLRGSQHYLYSAASIEVVRISYLRAVDDDAEQRLETMTIIGHFSRSARFANASYLPVLAKHWRILANDTLLQHSAFYRREIRTLFDRMPKRILLATRADDWLEPLKAVIDLANPLQLVANMIVSLQGNLDTLMVAISSKRFGPVVMQRILDALSKAGLKQQGYESYGVGPHRIILIAIERSAEQGSDQLISSKQLHRIILHCIVFWKDNAKAEILRHADIFDIPATLKELESISPLYQELFPPAQFSRDVQMRRRVLANARTCVHVRALAGDSLEVELHIYSLSQPSLGNLVDIIRAFDLDPVQESVVPFGCPDDSDCIHISVLTCRAARHLNNDDASRLRRGLALVLNDEADHDLINALIIRASLDIDAVAHLIALRNHLIQLMPDAAKLPLSDMMLRHADVSAMLHRLFAAHHLPAMPEDFLSEARTSFHQAMLDVASLSDDRWFRALAELVEAGLRTNAFVRQTGNPVAIKIDTSRLSFAAQPKPYREIFVHGVHVEGVHLRAGPIARGGLRYSDRPADFRTEVLELMSTQTVKNGQIVPTGSKGGFVIRDGQGADFVLQQYRNFIRSLLALTDNLADGENIPPAGIKIADCDQNDAYLVVAADKGTARFSDDANAEAQAAGFWLDDAFASGGEYGYDHKVVGITARGAWICATHHFAKFGIDACADAMSCVAIGDMGGDVFGNGMLLNPALKLVAAFNHQHIFIDPQPDVAKSFAERQRLFASVSGWAEYNTALISDGGGVFERSAKTIDLSVDVQAVLGIDAKALSGEALIRAILAAPVDLLYNGGIGTYVKASDETHMEVCDPANNAVRVDAQNLRCKVVCEGGNLGFTQKSRIEFAVDGGIINTDAMDNSAGVDMSDHEVNLKVLLASLPGKALKGKQRNRLLEQLTDAVTDQCLQDNLLQSRVLTLAELDAVEHPPRLQRLRDQLAALGWLDEAVAPRIAENDLLHLRPQLSILLGQEKNRIHAQLSHESFYQSSAFSQILLEAYFPAQLHQHYAGDFSQHPLSSEIIHTQAANHIVNHIGLAAVHHLQSMLDSTVSHIVEALLIAETVLDSGLLQIAIWDDRHDMEIALHLQRMLQEQLMLFAEALLRLCPVETLSRDWIETQQHGLADFMKAITDPGMAALAGNNHADLLDSIANSSLSQTHALHMAAMPQLARSACAVHLASTMDIPLQRCLLASQACLKVLPIEEMEVPLRSADWGSEDAHNLRREWLHRLTLLQSRAIAQLLRQPGTDFEAVAIQLWHKHVHWPAIEAYREQYMQGDAAPAVSGEARRSESKQMRLLLALTQLESVIDRPECCVTDACPL
ncbi:MAG: NAD-glutamate dehydrogenase [Mariprofundus sp.]|nr:NAD-glutamate dehydrogenase [Mariprofundus sp.]